MPQQELYELACDYVRTLDDAYLALDRRRPDFRPVLTATDHLSL